jgi:hypothetical protein
LTLRRKVSTLTGDGDGFTAAAAAASDGSTVVLDFT